MNQDSKATIHYAGDNMLVGISPSGHSLMMGVGDDRDTAATPLELLMIAVGGCTAVDVISILKKKRQIITDYRVEVRGERRDERPRSFTKFYVHHIVQGKSVSSEAVESAIKLSDEKYCSVADTVKPKAEVITSFEIIEDVSQ
jgi:putative redox protein